MVTGGVASVVYGDPRFTRDVDVVIELHEGNVESLESAFSSEDFYVPPRPVLVEESARPEGGHFNIVHRGSALRADVYTAGNDPLHQWALRHRSRIETEGASIALAPIEYVILRKLQYFRDSGSDRHLRDVAMMIRISGSVIDRPTLHEWIVRLDVGAEWERAQGLEPR
ncbi:MAG: nucleotidyl transferase AbiEii/AbiGii toxin family protein [Gemmatimonadota bacterium]